MAAEKNGDVAVPNSPSDTVSSLSWSPTANFFVAGSWNKEVSCYEVSPDGRSQGRAKTTHEAPVLCTAWSPDGTMVYSGSCDKTAKAWHLASNKSITIAKHEAPIKEIFYIPDPAMVVTGSWDKTVKFWDPRTPAAPKGSLTMPERVYTMDVRFPLMVVGTAERHIHVYDVRKPQRPYKEMQSLLKMQTRTVATFLDMSGFAVGSIEGRVAIQHIDDKNKDKNFTFKCHRQGHDNKELFAVNSIAFHPKYGTFATVGSDGVCYYWDKDSKQQLKRFERYDAPITCGQFNRDGSIYAFAVNYDWSRGAEAAKQYKPPQIMLHAVKDKEIKAG